MDDRQWTIDASVDSYVIHEVTIDGHCGATTPNPFLEKSLPAGRQGGELLQYLFWNSLADQRVMSSKK
ncbi:hypothetical protein BH09BAC1_BH09BAC1_06380 [soil metagenome]